ncbi:MAG TPA: tetratricopeptide repeat protein [Candidatus Binatia bacterium]|jgi:TolB-like protein/Tfp pilus assembly protein PilF
MKRCYQCNRVETDETLKFCRVDGAPLINHPSSVDTETGTAKFPSSSATSEIETTILPPVTDANVNRATAPTAALPAQQTPSATRDLTKPGTRKAVAIVAVCAAVVVAAIVIGGYIYSSRNARTAIQSIAVLPFVNESGNAENEYLSDGMTESLISSLSQIPGLNVKARSSVFRYKGKETDLQKIAHELNVQAVLNGRVVQRGEQLTLYLELVDVQTGNRIWGDQYNRKTSDLVALQSEIARDVSSRLKAKLSGADEQRLAKNYTENAEAYQLYLKGRYHWNRRTRKDQDKAVEYFNQAIAVDPNYALAYAGLADAYPFTTLGTWPEKNAKAREAALKAVSLDDNLAEAHTAVAQALAWYDWHFTDAERELRRAIELNPNYADAHYWYAHLLCRLGRWEEASAEYRRTLDLEPLSLIYNANYGWFLAFSRRYDEAIAHLKKTLELDENFGPTHSLLSMTYQLKGDYAASVEELAKALEIHGDYKSAALARESLAKGGWEGFLRYITGDSRPAGAPFPFYAVATFHAALGEKEKAFAALNKSYENREFLLTLLKVDPRLDPLRGDPRFQELLRKVGFPQ